MLLGSQYYRAPFPEERHWDDDLAGMAAAGLNSVQLWVLWSWVEPRPGGFVFDDYDRLVALAGKHGLRVVLSTIAEIQPLWIHRVVPGSELVTNLGQRVVSSFRGETHFGLTPGGCTDHPGIWERMAGFLETVARRYRDVPHLAGWDAWNELRWDVQADGLVCYCPHTLAAFRDWLDRRHGGLEGLNRAWRRRYDTWDEVMPGKAPSRPYTEMMAFAHFLTERACLHARARYDLIKAIDPSRPVTVHGGQPSAGYVGNQQSTALHRGNDWGFADHLDGIGCSSFPAWGDIDDAAFGARIEQVTSAARGKAVWLSELQGGRAASGFEVHAPVTAMAQQRWIWNGIAGGASAVLFWCWRDEVFGREAGGFGLIGDDGLAAERLREMVPTGRAIARYGDLLDVYRPSAVQVGVLFSPQTWYLHWAQEGSAHRARDAFEGYCRALVRGNIPYVVVEEEHLGILDELRILFLPRVLVLSSATEAALTEFVRGGGTLVVESECGAFDPVGIYRPPGDRWLDSLCLVREVGRRRPTTATVPLVLDGHRHDLPVTQWLTPLIGDGFEVLGEDPAGVILGRVSVDAGNVILLGAYAGEVYRRQGGMEFEAYVAWTCRVAEVELPVTVLEPAATAETAVYIKHGLADGRRLVFVFFPPGVSQVHLRFAPGFCATGALSDLREDEDYLLTRLPSGGSELVIERPAIGFAVLAEGA
jgi:beta-galactosidase